MTKTLKILLSNDDGVEAPGLAVLAKHVSRQAEITVVAPDKDRSGASNSLTLINPLRVKQLENGFFRVDGTPTDCVHLAVTGLLEEMPDMVVSGINRGSNLGDDVLYSGTVAAAMEGRFLGLPAIAVSLVGEQCDHYETAGAVVAQLIEQLQKDPLPANTILNVNVPDIPLEEVKGIEVTRLGSRHRAEPVIQQHDPRGRPIYWVGKAGQAQDNELGTDFYAVKEGYVSITPLKVDLTQYDAMDQVSHWVNQMGV